MTALATMKTATSITRCQACGGSMFPGQDATLKCLQCGRPAERVTPLPIESSAELGSAVIVKLEGCARSIAEWYEAIDDMRHEAARFVTIAATCGVLIPEQVAAILGSVPDYMVKATTRGELRDLTRCAYCDRTCRGTNGKERHERVCLKRGA